MTYISFHLKICYGGDVPLTYYCNENYKTDSLTEESYQVGCVKRGTALKLFFEVESAGSVLRYSRSNIVLTLMKREVHCKQYLLPPSFKVFILEQDASRK